MLNQWIVVARVEDIYHGNIIVRLKDDKNEDVVLTIEMPNSMLENVNNHLRNGDLVGLKGKFRGTLSNPALIAEKITFLSKTE